MRLSRRSFTFVGLIVVSLTSTSFPRPVLATSPVTHRAGPAIMPASRSGTVEMTQPITSPTPTTRSSAPQPSVSPTVESQQSTPQPVRAAAVASTTTPPPTGPAPPFWVAMPMGGHPQVIGNLWGVNDHKNMDYYAVDLTSDDTETYGVVNGDEGDTPVDAIQDGKIAFAGYDCSLIPPATTATNSCYGYSIVINHGDGYYSSYTHLANDQYLQQWHIGDYVAAYQRIGTMSDTGCNNNCNYYRSDCQCYLPDAHLHFALHYDPGYAQHGDLTGKLALYDYNNSFMPVNYWQLVDGMPADYRTNQGPWSVSLTASPSSVVATGTSVTLTATAYENGSATDVGPTPYWINIVDVRNRAVIASCGWGTTCQTDVNSSDQTTTAYVAYIETGVGVARSQSPLIVKWGNATPGTGQALGGVNMDGYCRAVGYWGGTLDGTTAYNWHCHDFFNNTLGINMDSTCAWQYPYALTVTAVTSDYSNPYSWQCYGIVPVFVYSGPPAIPVKVQAAAGWNMVGGSPPTIWSDATVNWVFNASSGQWYHPGTSEAVGTGIWEYVGKNGPRTVMTQQCSAAVSVAVVAHRWNLVGNPCSVPVTLPSTARAYWWDPSAQKYVLVTDINPGAATWVKPDANSLALTPS